MSGNAGNGQKWRQMTVNGFKLLDWLEIAGNGWKLQETAGNGWKFAGNCWNCWTWQKNG